MKLLFAGIFFAFVCTSQAGLVNKKDRVVDVKLSDEDPGTYAYDQEAFIGEEGVEETKELSPEQSKDYLRKIVYKLDADNDDKITLEEMKDWIEHTKAKHTHREASQNLEDYDQNRDNHITWKEYKDRTFGYLSEEDMESEKSENGVDYKLMMARDDRRWKKADKTGDGVLDFEELHHFLFPENYEFMKEIVIMETFEDIDKNKDGSIDLNEYIGDLWNPEDGEEEPEWVESERQQFFEHRDHDKNEVLDLKEIGEWIFPDEFDHVVAEARHLMHESDDDKDGVLSMEEIIDHYQNFVNSQITNYGADLRIHAEL